MLIQYIAESRPGGINDTGIEQEDISQLQALYQVGESRRLQSQRRYYFLFMQRQHS